MKIELKTVAQIAKGMKVSKDKQPNDTVATVVHLKFTDAVIDRDAIDELCGQPVGWSQGALFDELGAPVKRMTLDLEDLVVECTGTIRWGGNATALLRLGTAKVSGMRIALVDKAGLLSGELTWLAAGDETSDAEMLLARECGIHWMLSDSGQQDLLKAA